MQRDCCTPLLLHEDMHEVFSAELTTALDAGLGSGVVDLSGNKCLGYIIVA